MNSVEPTEPADVAESRDRLESLALCPDFPLDWDSPCEYHGFSKHTASRSYVVTLSLLKTQTQLGFFKTRLDAARAYDAALWKLRPFAPFKARPNFLSEFSDIDDDHVAQTCPHAMAAFERLARKAKTLGLSVEVLQATQSLRGVVAVDARSHYQKLLRCAENVAHANFSSRLRILQSPVNLMKLPALEQRKTAALAAVTAAAEAMREFSDDLRYHQELYEKMVADGIISIQ